ncbi:acetoacetate decarboxylase family protein [Gottfriedia sp. NPDC057948]|uniref:acetoacetate decarboxylase family protein n=1 Tax=Gottfriedia sp. NPDC057948 TaxID=3346287 RepID=UPI0036DB6EDD
MTLTKGKLTKSSLGASMPSHAPLYPSISADEKWDWTNIDVVIVDYLTDEKVATEILPEQCSLVPIPNALGQAASKLILANYRGGSLEPYYEIVQGIPCIHNEQLFMYVANIYVTTDSAMAAGREIWGFPKKIADVTFENNGGDFKIEVSRQGHKLISCSFKEGGKLVSVPLPANESIELPPPYNMNWPLPPANGTPQPIVLPIMTLRHIPNFHGCNDQWATVQLVGTNWSLDKGEMTVGEAALDFYPSEKDPIAKLPVNMILDAVLYRGDMSLSGNAASLLEDIKTSAETAVSR